MTGIPAGYQLHVTTWESAYDHYKTQVLSGLTKEDVEFYLDLMKPFFSKHDMVNPGTFGNEKISVEVLIDMVMKLLGAHPNISQAVSTKWNTALANDLPGDLLEYYEVELYDVLCDDVLGVSEFYEDTEELNLWCREIGQYKILYIDQSIPDVTSLFNK